MSETIPAAGLSGQSASPQAAELMVHVLEKVYPLEADLVGQRTLNNIVRGVEYKEVQGGGHINLVDTMSVLSATVGVVQCILTVWNPFQAHANPAAVQAVYEISKEKLATITEAVSKYPALADLVAKDPKLIERVCQAIVEFLKVK